MIDVATPIYLSQNSSIINDFLKAIYKSYEKGKNEGLSFLCFQEAFPLPMFIGKIFFNCFDSEKKGNLSEKQFVDNVTKLYSGRREVTFVSQILDFDLDGFIQEEDVRLIFSHFHLSLSKTKTNVLDQIITKFFGSHSLLSVGEFKHISKTENSDILFLFFFYLSKFKPVSEEQINYFSTIKKEHSKCLREKNATHTRSSIFSEAETSIKLPSELVSLYTIEIIKEEDGVENELNCLDIFESDIKTSIASFVFDDPQIIDDRENKNQVDEKVLFSKRLKSFFQSRPTFHKKQKMDSLSHVTKLLNELSSNLVNSSTCYTSLNFAFNHENIIERGEMIVYYMKPNGQLTKRKLVRIGNVLFVTKNTSAGKIRLKKILPLNSIFIQACDKLKINDVNYYRLHLLSNTVESTIFLITSKKEVDAFIRETNLSLNNRKFEDDYELIEEIGQGKFGTVSKCRNIWTGEFAAVKFLNKSSLTDQSLLEMARWEIAVFKIFLNTSHPGIIQSKDYYETFTDVYLVFEFIPGGNLKNYLMEREYALSIKEFLNITNQLANALSYLHKLGIVHRDIKLENIVIQQSVSGKMIIKLIDFGLSKIMGKHELAFESYGSLLYASPEIVQKSPYSHKADVWSLGILLHFIYYGKFPFMNPRDTEFDEQIEKYINDFPGFPVILNGMSTETDKVIRNIIRRCLKKENLRFNIDNLIKMLGKSDKIS